MERIRIQDGVPKLYLVTIVGHEDREVPLLSKDLIFRSRFVNRVLEVVDQLVDAELQKKSDKAFAKKLAKVDAKERAHNDARGYGSARFRHGDTWLWFAFTDRESVSGGAGNPVAVERQDQRPSLPPP